MGQIHFRQAKKPLIKGFFMYSLMPPTGLEPVTHRLRVYCSTN